jgi:hypothetical protein
MHLWGFPCFIFVQFWHTLKRLTEAGAVSRGVSFRCERGGAILQLSDMIITYLLMFFDCICEIYNPAVKCLQSRLRLTHS